MLLSSQRPILNSSAYMQRLAQFFRQIATGETAKKSTEQLAGTVINHRLYLLLHTPKSPLTYPARKTTAIQKALQLKLSKWGGIVNFAHRPDLASVAADNEDSDTRVRATAYSMKSGILEIPEITMDNVDAVEHLVHRHALEDTDVSVLSAQVESASGLGEHIIQDQIHIYVCTHGERDCRCGDLGSRVYRALQNEVQQRKLEGKVIVGEVGHVGAHHLAANMLVYPYGEWLGQLTPAVIPEVLQSILLEGGSGRPRSAQDRPICLSHWRGRQGMDKATQTALHNKWSSGI